jgi:hypothetical protein
MSKHVFLSFVEEDLAYVRLFRGQARNKNTDLEFDDYSVKVPYNSTNADYIRSQITTKIRAASATIVLIGATTSSSAWVAWEIEKTAALGKKLIGVKLSTAGKTPRELTDADAPVVNWDISKIVAELE